MNIDSISMSFGTQVIFNNASVILGNNDKVGVVGPNGAGKSTLFKLILNELDLTGGSINLNNKNIGYLPQVITDEIPSSDITVFEYLLEGRPIDKLQKELTSLYNDISIEKDNNKLNRLMKRIDKVNDLLNYYNQYEAESILLKIINGMNIDSELLDLKLINLSGGQKSKIAFARLLYSKKEVLLLDEPTNHLDIDTKDYIINYLKSYNGLILVISHDISFLNEITNKTLYVDKIKHNLILYNGNYDKYIKIKKERDLTRQRLYDKQIKEEEKLKTYVEKLSNLEGINFILNLNISNIDDYGPIALWIVLDNKYYDRNRVILGAMNMGIPIGSFNYNTIIKNDYFKNFILNKEDNLKNSQYIRDNSIFLPLYESLSLGDIEKICEAFKYVINNYENNIEIFDESGYDEEISYFDGFYLMRK